MKNKIKTPHNKKTILYQILIALASLVTFPILIIAALVIGVNVGLDAENYTFWPYVPLILMIIFALIFAIVCVCLNTKKSLAKHSANHRIISLVVTTLCLTTLFGVIWDVILPDILSFGTITTIFIEDIYSDYAGKAAEIKSYEDEFISLNLLNGNYDSKYEYENMKESDSVKTIYNKYNAYDLDGINKIISNLSGDKQNLYEYVYKEHVMLDYDYCLAYSDAELVSRKAMTLAITEVLLPKYSELCEAGITSSNHSELSIFGLGGIGRTGDDFMSWLFIKQYGNLAQDAFYPYSDDAGIMHVTSNRVTPPVLLNLVLNEHYEVTMPYYAKDENGNYKKDNEGNYIVEGLYADVADKKGNQETIDGGFLAYVYYPDIAEGIISDNSLTDADFDSNGRTKIMYEYDGKMYYAYKSGHVECQLEWMILDMVSNPVQLLSLDLEETVGDIMDIVGPLLSGFGDNVDELLNEDLVEVIELAANGEKVYLNVSIDDDGYLNVTLYPATYEYGSVGFLFGTWLYMANLLLCVCALVPMRDVFYILGAVALVGTFCLALLIEELRKEKQKLIAQQKLTLDEQQSNNSTFESVDDNDGSSTDDNMVHDIKTE